jgi:hypothetical protein
MLTFLSVILDVMQRYRFVRFDGVGGDRTEEKLQYMMDANPEASDAIQDTGELKDGSYGMLVCSDYIPTLQEIMSDTFPGSKMAPDYHPLLPSTVDIDYWGYSSAEALYAEWFEQRMSTCASEVGQEFYKGVKAGLWPQSE